MCHKNQSTCLIRLLTKEGHKTITQRVKSPVKTKDVLKTNECTYDT